MYRVMTIVFYQPEERTVYEEELQMSRCPENRTRMKNHGRIEVQKNK